MKIKLSPFYVLVALLVLWELSVNIFSIPKYLLPAPSSIFKVFIDDPKTYLYHSSVTLFEALIGFILANIFGFFFAIIFAFNKRVQQMFMPYAIALKTTPIIAMAPILILWTGTGIFSKIVTSSLICFFPILVNAIKGLHSTSNLEIDLFISLKATKLQTFYYLQLPKSFPYLFSAFKISATLSVVGAIVGEFVGATKGIGYLIVVSSYRLETEKMFIGIFASAIIGMLFYTMIALLEKKMVFWKNENNI